MRVHMTNCPNCKTIQKVGTSCTICKCPVTAKVSCSLPTNKLTGEDFELESRKQIAKEE